MTEDYNPIIIATFVKVQPNIWVLMFTEDIHYGKNFVANIVEHNLNRLSFTLQHSKN